MPATQEFTRLPGSVLHSGADDIADVVAVRALVAESLYRAPFWMERYELIAPPRRTPVPLAMLRRTAVDFEPDESYEVVVFVAYEEPDELDDTPW